MALIELGLLEEVTVAENRTARRPTNLGLSMGVILEARTRVDGTGYAIIDIHNAEVGKVKLKKAQERINAPMQGSVWTEEQERVLIAMFHHGEPVAKIAEKLQRTTGGIAAKLHKLGLIENRKDIK